jgi:hypothetical protein
MTAEKHYTNLYNQRTGIQLKSSDNAIMMKNAYFLPK